MQLRSKIKTRSNAILKFLAANPSEGCFLVGSVVRHNLGCLGKIIRAEYESNRVAFYLHFNGGPFHRKENRYFLYAFEQGTLEFITVPKIIKERLKINLSVEEEKKSKARAKKRLSLVRSEDPIVFTLPMRLQTFITEEIGWEYEPVGIEYENTEEVRISQYLGTYFPRSFSEAYFLFSLLFQKEQFFSKFLEEHKISIIDIGTGTGGNFFGFLWALKDHCLLLGYNFPNIEFTAVEKNEQALNVQIKLIKEFFPDHINFKSHSSDFLSGADFLKDLTDNVRFDGSTDLIMCWKFICEFYSSRDKYMQNNEMYGSLLTIANQHLKEHGILTVCDVTKRAYDPDGAFLPCVMNREVQKILISGKTDLAPILPLSCAHWWQSCLGKGHCFLQKHFSVSHSALPSSRKQDGQGVCLKVFGRKEFSKLLLRGEDEAKGYIVARTSNGGFNTCQSGKVQKMTSEELDGSEARFYSDAFEWTGKGNLIIS